MKYKAYLLQKRLAYNSVSASTVRGNPAKTKEIAINYLKQLNLSRFSGLKNEQNFKRVLNKLTKQLRNRLPNKNWGVARKIINVFIFQAILDNYLSQSYKLKKLLPYLEIPLDNPNALYLKKEAKKKGIRLYWKGIIHLNPKVNQSFQDFASTYAKKYVKCKRGYLDLYLWPPNDSEICPQPLYPSTSSKQQ